MAVGTTLGVGGGAIVSTGVVQYIVQWLHMPPMNTEVAGAFAVALMGAAHIAALIVKKRFGVDVEAAVKE